MVEAFTVKPCRVDIKMLEVSISSPWIDEAFNDETSICIPINVDIKILEVSTSGP
jgi:hypothetical protein